MASSSVEFREDHFPWSIVPTIRRLQAAASLIGAREMAEVQSYDLRIFYSHAL